MKKYVTRLGLNWLHNRVIPLSSFRKPDDFPASYTLPKWADLAYFDRSHWSNRSALTPKATVARFSHWSRPVHLGIPSHTDLRTLEIQPFINRFGEYRPLV